MKDFLKYLGAGLAITVCAVLLICGFIWGLHSVHRMLWFAAAVVCGGFILQYMVYPQSGPYLESGKTVCRRMTFKEKAITVIERSIGVAIIGALLWTIGYGIACVFDWFSNYWEIYLLYGIAAILAIWLVFALAIQCCDYVSYYRKRARLKKAPKWKMNISPTLKKIMMWMAVGVCSLAVAAGLLYFLLPLALKS